MLCLPGFTPVAKLAQATGDSEGCVVSSFANVPCSDSRLRFGSLPSSIHLRASVGSIPSKPSTNTRCLARRTGLPEEELQAVSSWRRRPGAEPQPTAERGGARSGGDVRGGFQGGSRTPIVGDA